MPILNIAGYRFVILHDLLTLKSLFLSRCSILNLKGTILISSEGININLAGEEEQIRSLMIFLQQDSRFHNMKFHQTWSATIPFQRLKVKIKKEIITLRQEQANPTVQKKETPRLSPKQLKKWLDEKKNIILLDTRNDYEIKFGTFKNAIDLQLKHFIELPDKLHSLSKQQEMVLFCTGGIRCEKAGLYLQSQGFNHLYQLDGGILGYFQEVGREHYEGQCFVFDERIAIEASVN